MEIHSQGLSEFILATVTACFTLLLGHNLWLVAKDENDQTVIEVVTSDDFPVSDSAVKPERVADFRLVSKSGSTPITNYEVMENSLVAGVERNEFACFAALELHPHPIILEAAKFAGYVKSEDAEKRVAPQFVENVTAQAQRESYTKYAKVLLNAPGEKQSDVFTFAAGHRLEIVPQNSLSTLRENEKLTVKVLFEGKPIRDLRVSSGCEKLNEGKYLAHAQTDENGSAAIEISGAGLWFVRTHFIRPHSDSSDFDWESFWASMTFRI